jgi:hypothetical protein
VRPADLLASYEIERDGAEVRDETRPEADSANKSRR